MVKARKAHLVLAQDNRSWIIEKMAARIAEHAPAFGFAVSVGEAEDADADVNHWMSYAFANVPHNTPATMLITHLDDPYKVGLVKSELTSGVDVGIALSSHTCDTLVAAGVGETSLAFAVPGHDFAAAPRRIVIGLTTRLYADGRKREAMLVEMARTMRLDRFRFEIFGLGWEDVIPLLEAAGAEVAYSPGTDDFRADYVEMMARVPAFDYYLYLGRDEGSLGTLDALAAGVKTIVTPQGFHVDLPGGITHAIWSQEELETVFRDLAEEVDRRAGAVAGLTWQSYAEAHTIIWHAILDGRVGEVAGLLAAHRGHHAREIAPVSEGRATMLRRLVSPYRIRSALSHIPLLKPVRAWVKGR
ncbi:hypothetical protein E5675_10115 [Sphingopyxis sp. PAMC25046]|uniref:hypothetical protein n=1 Tax=Sphingopyxis sp. PAMC25046 TaxID=2565556 RepID=UPI00109E1678|nr:hypothetical protein [Sphingopyxis sp. PAMC25046]QCB54751.1 hypothetical protein E5675_10115 [Sphingopyxis sp. PAMC25046]